MNSKQFLQIGGMVLVLIAILGFSGIIGPTEMESPFGATWYFDNAENSAHLVIGIAALIFGFGVKNAMLQKNITILVGVLGILFAVYNIFSENFMSATLQNPADMILHLVIGVFALWTGTRKPEMNAPIAGAM